MATMIFNKTFNELVKEIVYQTGGMEEYLDDGSGQLTPTEKHYVNILNNAAQKGAMFDARCFNIPKEEVANLIYWRQLDATSNSIQMLGQSEFSHKELQGKSCNDIQDMLMVQKNINWNDLPIYLKRGIACYKSDNGWYIDKHMPIIKGEDRAYVEKYIFIDE